MKRTTINYKTEDRRSEIEIRKSDIETRNASPEIPNPQSEIPKPKSEIPKPKSEIPKPKSEIPNPKSEIQNTPHWYALYTRARFEKKVDSKLREKKLESYLPLHTVIRQWSDRKKKVEIPLFSCYVFVRIPLMQRLLALQTEGVVRMVAFNGTPSPIPDEEINAVKKILDSSENFETTQYLPIGQMVEVIRGPFEGIRGRLNEYRGRRRLLVGIEQIGQAISVEINTSEVRPIT